jgi:hypothetical protein
MLDRMKSAWVALARGAHHAIDYQTFYRAQVLRQHGNGNRLDLKPTDPRLPQMSNIPLKVGVPGLEVTITPGHFVLVAWENGRPDQPYATLWDPGELGTTPIKLTLNAATVELGGAVALPVQGVLTGEATDPFTGLPHWMLGNASLRVGAKKS